ncbi:hypothetical protein LUR56_36990 [Streptomyces sp. MT29]|nr:hypothetical protein [Streptomyces sp. MT29]
MTHAGQTAEGSVAALFRVALLRDGRGLRIGLTTVAFMVHQLCEALVPVLIGVVIAGGGPGGPGRPGLVARRARRGVRRAVAVVPARVVVDGHGVRLRRARAPPGGW